MTRNKRLYDCLSLYLSFNYDYSKNCQSFLPPPKKKPPKNVCIHLKYGGVYAFFASYFNQPYLITEIYYYGTETGIFACFNNLEE